MAPKAPETRRLSKPAQWVMALAVCTFLTGCGPLGQDDNPDEPLVTVQASEHAAISTPVPRVERRSAGTPAFDPIGAEQIDAPSNSTPSTDTAGGNAMNRRVTADDDRATPIPRTGVGDGTSGATPPP